MSAVGRTHQAAASLPAESLVRSSSGPGGAARSAGGPARRRRSRCVYCGYGHGPACAQHWDLLKLDPHYLA